MTISNLYTYYMARALKILVLLFMTKILQSISLNITPIQREKKNVPKNKYYFSKLLYIY